MAIKFIRGNLQTVKVTYPASTAFAQGDLVAFAGPTNDLTKASQETWSSSLAGTQTNFHDKFLGVCLTTRLAGQADAAEGLVAVSGIFECSIDSIGQQVEVGEFIGPAKASGNALENQEVDTCATAALAIGRCAETAPAGSTTVLVNIQSTLFGGGAQASA